MITTQCPRCDESIRIPSGQLPADAYAQCPLCLETFPASDVTDQLPPMLMVMGADGQPINFSDYSSDLHSNDLQAVGHQSAGSVGALASGAVGAVAGVATAAAPLLGGGGEPEYQNEGLSEQSFDSTDDITITDEFSPEEAREEDDDPSGGFVESGDANAIDSSSKTVLLDTWQEGQAPQHGDAPGDGNLEMSEHGVELGLESTDTGAPPSLEDLVNDESAMVGDLKIVEDELEIPEEQPGFNEKDEPQTVRRKRRFRRPEERRNSPMKMIIGGILSFAVAVPAAGALLIAAGHAPDWGFYPFDGTYAPESEPTRVAADQREPTSVAGSVPRTNGQNSGLVTPEIPGPGSQDPPSLVVASGDANLVESPQPRGLSMPTQQISQTSSEQETSEDAANPAPTGPFEGGISMEPPKRHERKPPKQKDIDEGPGLGERLSAWDEEPAAGPVGQPAELGLPDESNSPPQVSVVEKSTAPSPSPESLSMKVPSIIPSPTKPKPISSDSEAVMKAVDKASKALTALATKRLRGEAIKSDIGNTYVAVSRLGESEAHPSSPAVNGLLSQIARSVVLGDFDGEPADVWLGLGSRRTTEGILLIGRSNAADSTIRLDSGTIIKASFFSGKLPDGKRVMALGKITDAGEKKVDIRNLISLE